MDFQFKRFKTLLTIILLIIAKSSFASNTEIPILHEITIENLNLISVKVYAPLSIQKDCIFSFNNSTPNYYLAENNIQYIKNFKVALNNGETVSHKTAANIKIEEDFKFIEYQFIIEDIDSTSFLPVKNILNENSYLNFSSFLGSFNTDTVKEITVKVFKDKKRIFSKTNQFTYFINNPLCLCYTDNFSLENLEITIQTNKTNFVATERIKTLVTESIFAITKYPFLDSLKIRKLIFLFDTTSKNAGAITRKENIVFHFNTDNEYIIQKTILHELFHWIVPYQESWLNEAIPEYLALKTMLQNNLISDKQFLEKMSHKIKLAETYNKYSLDEIFKNPKFYRGSYSKGTVYAWILDILIQKTSQFELNIENYLLNLKNVPNDSKQNVIQALILFETNYIQNNQPLSFNKYLQEIDILYEKNKLIEIKEKQKIVLKDANEKVVIANPAGIDCLEKGDIIISLDGKKNKADIIKKMQSFTNKDSKITVLREEKKIRFKLDNQRTIFLKIPHFLSITNEANKTQSINWFKFANQLN